jgi:putative DNA primase/helicase
MSNRFQFRIDEAIRRRFNLIPFTVTIPPTERDETLSERLQDEWPGILAWMIEGCAGWRQRGLAPSVSVTAATAAYLDSQDALAAWIEECCEQRPSARASRTALFESWMRWATASGEHVGTRKRFLEALEGRGFEPYRRSDGRGFLGLNIISPDFGVSSSWNN